MIAHDQPGFAITAGKGFHITFDNGYTVSVQWGWGNYCDLRNDHKARESIIRGVLQEVTESRTAETAAWGPDGEFLDGDVNGFQSPAEVLAFLNRVAALPAILTSREREALGMDPSLDYCDYCIDAYRNGIEPGGSACDDRAHPE